MKKSGKKCFFVFLVMFLLILVGCSKNDSSEPVVNAVASIEAASEVLNNVFVTLPDGMTRETVSNIQHDFIREGKQIGGIVIVDVSDEMLDSPYDSYIKISDLLGQQLMPDTNPDDIACMGAGGSEYAYMEITTGQVDGADVQYFHCLFRGNAHNYDMWFNADFVDTETMSAIMESMSSEDIPAELNISPF